MTPLRKAMLEICLKVEKQHPKGWTLHQIRDEMGLEKAGRISNFLFDIEKKFGYLKKIKGISGHAGNIKMYQMTALGKAHLAKASMPAMPYDQLIQWGLGNKKLNNRKSAKQMAAINDPQPVGSKTVLAISGISDLISENDHLRANLEAVYRQLAALTETIGLLLADKPAKKLPEKKDEPDLFDNKP